MIKSVKRYMLLLIVFFISSIISAQQNYEMIKLSENLYKFNQKDFVNMFAFINEEGIILIDSGLDDFADLIKEELNKISDGKIKYIINTHSDYDHIAGNGKLREGAVIISHENCRNELIMYGSPESEIPFDKAHYHNGLPDITFNENMTLHFGGETIHMSKMFGGHSSSDITVWFEKNNFLFTGDIIVPNSFPVVKLHRGSSLNRLKEILTDIISSYKGETILCVGHGGNATINHLSPMLNMITETEKIIVDLMNDGFTLEEIKSRNALKDYSKWSGTVFEEVNYDMWIETIYNDNKTNK